MIPKSNKKVPPVPPGSDKETLLDKPGLIEEFDDFEDDSLESFITEIEDKYPEAEAFICRVYRNTKPKKSFVTKFTYVPEEEELQAAYGGGSYILMFFVKEQATSKPKLVRTLTIAIEGKPKLAGEESAPGIVAPGGNSEMEMLTKMKLYKDLFANDNSGGGNDMTAIIGMIQESNKENRAMMMDVIKSMGKNDNSDMTTKLFDIVIKSTESKIDPFEQIAKVLELKDSLGGGGDNGGGFNWGEIIKAVAPSLMAAMMNKNGGQGEEQSGQPQPVHYPPPPQQNPGALLSEMKKIARAEAKAVVEEEFPIVEEPTDTTAPEIQTEEHQEARMEDINSKSANNQEEEDLTPPNQPTEEEQKAMQFIINQLKSAPEAVKIQTLKEQLKQYSTEEVKKWILDNGILKDEAEFNEYLKKAGYEPVEVVKPS